MRKASDKLYEIITPVVEALGYELVGIEYISQGKHSVLRLYIDSEKGIVVDDCAEISHQVSGVLDVEDPIRGVYHLEVSSPGLDRPLFNEEHYERFTGHQVKIQLTAPLNGRRKFQGVLL
ncbi:MAG: ribosome maturation factor RimP, partial [Gammaproteobacteria bacterium]|nr:ribosome maturation factor RimP [Gammaproteobacteria bacterium]